MSAQHPKDQQEAMQQVRSIQLGAGSIYASMQRTFTLPIGSEERELATLTLRTQIEDYLTLPGNAPDTALLALGKLATEVSLALGQRTGLSTDQVVAQVDQYIVSEQVGG